MANSRSRDDGIPLAVYSRSQKIGQECIRFMKSATLPYWAYEVLPPFALSYKGALEIIAVPVSYIFYSAQEELTDKHDPLRYPRELGNGHAEIGLLKLGLSSATALGALMLVGNTGSDIGFRYLPELIQSSQWWAKILAKTLIIDAYRWAALGTMSYLFYRGVQTLSMKMWDCVVEQHEQPERVNDQPLSLVQKAGQYVVRWTSSVAITETVLFYLRDNQYRDLALEPHLQISVLLLSDILLQLGKYFFFSPHTSALNNENQDQQRQPGKPFLKQAGIFLAVCVSSYFISEMISLLHSNCEPVEECDLRQRMLRFTVAFALSLTAQYVAEELVPRSISACKATFFDTLSEDNLPLYAPASRSIKI